MSNDKPKPRDKFAKARAARPKVTVRVKSPARRSESSEAQRIVNRNQRDKTS